jgi:proteasome lid subunit RPN8/RPN11
VVSQAEPGSGRAHPGPAAVRLPDDIRAALVEHARREYPNEACGIVIGSGPAAAGGQARRFAPTRNAAASPYRYEIDSSDLLRLTLDADDADEAFWAIVHSHVRSPARPSPTDLGLAFYPDALYILGSDDRRAWCARVANRRRRGPRGRAQPVRALVPLGAGLAALVAGTLFGWDARVVEVLVSPPVVVRSALVAAAVVIGAWLLVRAVAGLSVAGQPGDARDVAGMVRAVRLVFLSVAAFAASAGWVLGSPLPLVLALVIAGIDVVETSLLLLVVGARRGSSH